MISPLRLTSPRDSRALRTINSTPTQTPPPSDVLDVKGAAVLLLINRVTVTEYAQAGTIPGRLIGNRWRFSRACLMHWLESSASA